MKYNFNFKSYFELEKSYFWIASHLDTVMHFARPFLRLKENSKNLKILDAGCGYGHLTGFLKPWGQVYMVDADAGAVDFCCRNQSRLVQQALANKLPFKDNTFDFIFSLDLIEHTRDDLSVMRELYRVLRPGGILFITVPAFMCLWGPHDEKNEHFHRYSKKDIIRITKESGFKILRCHYFKFILFLPLWILRRAKIIGNRESGDFYAVPSVVNAILRIILKIETRLISLVGAPAGTSLIAVSVK